MPFVDKIRQISKSDSLNSVSNNEFVLEYDHIIYKGRCLTATVPFKFADSNLSTLFKVVIELPQMKRQFVLKLGSCIEDLTIE